MKVKVVESSFGRGWAVKQKIGKKWEVSNLFKTKAEAVEMQTEIERSGKLMKKTHAKRRRPYMKFKAGYK